MSIAVVRADLDVRFGEWHASLRERDGGLAVTILAAETPRGSRRMIASLGSAPRRLGIPVVILDAEGRILALINPASESRVWAAITGSPYLRLRLGAIRFLARHWRQPSPQR